MELELRNVGQLDEAEVEFGDLTVLVGPQASGKSIFLQFLKLMIDGPKISADFKTYGYDWQGELSAFLNLYMGEGMQSLWTAQGEGSSAMTWKGAGVDLEKKLGSFAKARLKQRSTERMFFIPAQRVLSLNLGWPRPFTDFAAGDPYVVPSFSEKLRMQMEAGLGGGKTGSVFPQSGRLKKELRDTLDAAVFRGFSLKLDRVGGVQKRLVLEGEGEKLPFMVWSAGQREFVPLLLGLYWLCPSAKIAKRDATEWVVVEEPEMGLHPEAISAVMLVVLELLWRGYRVVLSTHSPHVLDVVWGLRTIQECRASPDNVIDMFGLQRHSPQMRKIAAAAIEKEYRVFYFDRPPGCSGHVVRDISALDPGAADSEEAGWGGLTEFSGRVGEVVAQIVASANVEGSG